MGSAPRSLRSRLAARESLVPRWVPWLFVVLSAALIPGIVRVLTSAPPLHFAEHWRLAWGGFDVGLAFFLAVTGAATFRRSAFAQVLAAMTATLLCCDAWQDVLNSLGQGVGATVISVAEAVLAELPLAAVFGWTAIRFARVVTVALPVLQRAGFMIRHGRLLAPADGYPPKLAADPVRSPASWRQWTYSGRRQSWLLPWWLPAGCFSFALALLPWIAWLFLSLPGSVLVVNWGLARAGFAVALAVALAVSALALARGWPVAEVLVAVVAALLLRDAWFNVLTAGRAHAGTALGIAAGLELPLAALCLWVAVVHARAVAVAWPYVRDLALSRCRDDRAGADRPAGRGSRRTGDGPQEGDVSWQCVGYPSRAVASRQRGRGRACRLGG